MREIKKFEVPVLSEREKHEMFTKIWVSHMYGAAVFITEKLGLQGLEEYNERRTEQSVKQFKATEKNDPVAFAVAQAIKSKNVFGSNVEVLQNEDGSVTLNIKECARLKSALNLAKRGISLTRVQYCGLCINGYYKKVADKLGFYLDVKFTDKGCKMIIRK